MSDVAGIQRAAAAIAVQPAAPGTTTSTPIPPALTRVQLPARVTDPVRPKRPAEPLTSPREQDGGKSPLSSSSLADSYAAVEALQGRDPDAGNGGGSTGASADEAAAQASFLQLETAADHDFAAGRYAQYSNPEGLLEELGA